MLLPSESKIVRLDIQKRGENIGYIEGAGDVVPESLRQIGYNVAIIKPEDITEENLQKLFGEFNRQNISLKSLLLCITVSHIILLHFTGSIFNIYELVD